MESPRKEAPAGFGAEAPIKKISQQPADPAVVALRMEDLSVWVIERVAKMPREAAPSPRPPLWPQQKTASAAL